MKNIFLDFGANRLQGLLYFSEKLKIDSSWCIQSYEADPSIYDAIKSPDYLGLLDKRRDFYKFQDFQIFNLAVSNCNKIDEIKCVKQITLNQEVKTGDYGGSTLLKDNIWHPGHDNVVFETSKIETIDVNKIISNVVVSQGKDCKIYIKCDIEGYEYDVLNKLLLSDHLENIKQIYVEWHSRFFSNQKEKKEEELILKSKFTSNNIEIHDHF